MKKLILSTCCALLALSSFGKQGQGYKIEINFKHDVTDTFVYLAHYFAKPLPTIYKTDSGRVLNKRKVIIESQDSVLGGIYMILFNNKSAFTELLINNGDQFVMNIDTTNIPANITFQNSAENGKKQQEYMEALKVAKNAADTQKIKDRSNKDFKELVNYRKDYVKKHPNTLLSTVFSALMTPEVPEGPHYIVGTKNIDSNFSYNYYKKHYWDGFALTDNRLINTPIYDGRLDEYFNKLVIPIPDSMNMEADKMLAITRPAKEMFKYTLHWLAGNAEKSKVMGMDEVFVHLVEKYYMKGDAFWLDSTSLAKYEERAKKIAPNVLGNTAPDLLMQDAYTLQDKPLSKHQSKYTVLVFWNKDCSHCTEEVPRIDSVYQKVLKSKGVSIYAVSTGGELSEIQKTIEKLGVKNWTNVVDVSNKKEYESVYDVYATPKVYLLDENKKIIGKGLDHSNIHEVIDFVEKKKKK
jgi:peroxiredoxin